MPLCDYSNSTLFRFSVGATATESTVFLGLQTSTVIAILAAVGIFAVAAVIGTVALLRRRSKAAPTSSDVECDNDDDVVLSLGVEEG